MLNDFRKFMQEQDLPQKNIVSVAADGVPAMVGKHNRFFHTYVRKFEPEHITAWYFLNTKYRNSDLKC